MTALLQPATFSRTNTSINLFGIGGSGKSLTALLIALGNSIERQNRAGIALVDPEDVSDFLLTACRAEGVPLFTMKRRTFIDMREALPEAVEKGCGSFLVDHYDAFHRELQEAQKDALDLRGRRLPFQHREELIRLWESWVRDVRASRIDCIFNGRLAWNWGDSETEDGDVEHVRLGTKMRGDSDADYEPDLLIEMELLEKRVREQKSHAKRVDNIHFAYIRKDRTQALSGMQFQWKDLHGGYKVGDYKAVWKCFAPYFAGFKGVSVSEESHSEPPRTSAALFQKPTGETRFSERQKRVTIAVEEIQGAMNAIWPGSTNEDKRLKSVTMEMLFHSRSWTAVETMLPEALESAQRSMTHFETALRDPDQGVSPKDEAAVVALLLSCLDLEKSRADVVGML